MTRPQPRISAGVPTGGQFARTNRPEATDVELVDDEGDPVRQALSDIERLGAETADCYAEMGRAAAALPSTARTVVGEALGTSSRHDDRDALVPRLAEIALRRAAWRAGIAGERLDDVLRGIPKFMVGSIRTDLERSARYHVRQALSLEDDGDTSWVCPVDPGHATRDGICVACGVRSIANHPGTEQVPAFDEPEGAVPSSTSAARSGVGSDVPSKPEPVLRELVSELHWLQTEADAGNDDDMASFWGRAAGMLDAAIADAFSGHGAGREPTQNRVDKNSIDPASIDWTACGDADEPGGEDAQLLGTIQIGPTSFHVLALQVEGEQEAQRSLQRDEDLSLVMNALGDQSPYETVEIDGRPYVLLISPHSR